MSREKFVVTHSFNEALTAQLRDCLMSGRMPRPLCQIAKATPLRSPEGTLTEHPGDRVDEPAEVAPARAAPWKVTPLQERILAAWEALHGEFRVVADDEHKPTKFAPWRYRIERKADASVAARFSKYAQDIVDPGIARDAEKLRSCLKNGSLPKAPWIHPARRRDPVTGWILPTLRHPAPATVLSPPASQAHPPIEVPEGSGLPKPWPTCGEKIVLTGENARFWKYGAHPEDYDEFEDRKAPRLKPGSKEYAKAKREVALAKSKLDSSTREELTRCAKLASQMADKESAHILAVKATLTKPATGTAAGF